MHDFFSCNSIITISDESFLTALLGHGILDILVLTQLPISVMSLSYLHSY